MHVQIIDIHNVQIINIHSYNWYVIFIFVNAASDETFQQQNFPDIW